LNLLVTLDAILTEKNLTRAGDHIGLSQPTMSHNFARLRDIFNDELLTRVGREYYLTPVATELIEPLRDTLKNIELMIERRPVFDPHKDKRSFSIAATDYDTYLLLRPAIEMIQEAAPEVSLHIKPLNINTKQQVLTGDIDLGLMPVATGLELPSEELWSDHWVAAVSVDDADLIEPLSLEQYLQRPHLVYSTGLQDISSLADRAIYASNPEARIAVSTHSFVLIPMLLGHSRLVALVNERLASQFASFAGIKLLEVLFDMPDISEAMYWHPRFTTDPAHRWLRSLLKKCAEANLTPKSKTGASDRTDRGAKVSKKARSNGP